MRACKGNYPKITNDLCDLISNLARWMLTTVTTDLMTVDPFHPKRGPGIADLLGLHSTSIAGWWFGT